MMALALAAVLALGGMAMIFMDLRSEGSIAIKTPFISGSLNATYIGLFVIFLGVVLAAIALLRGHKLKESLEISSPNDVVKYESRSSGSRLSG